MTPEALVVLAEKLLARNPELAEDARTHPGNSEVGAVLGLVSSAPRWLTERAVASMRWTTWSRRSGWSSTRSRAGGSTSVATFRNLKGWILDLALPA